MRTCTAEDGETYLDDGLGLDEVRTAPDDDRRLALGRDLVHGLPQRLQVLEPARAVRVDHEKPFPSPM